MKNNTAALWTGTLARHAVAANAYATAAGAVDADSWSVPVAEGKWSPAQVTEHLNKTYQVIIAELRGGPGIRIRSSWLVRQLLRQTVLHSIIRKRRLPKGARAPLEVMPRVVEGSQADVIDRFTHLAHEFAEVCEVNRAENRGRKLTHHIFGEIELSRGVDFVTIHIEHHQRQIERKD
jgi:DinB superfamily